MSAKAGMAPVTLLGLVLGNADLLAKRVLEDACADRACARFQVERAGIDEQDIWLKNGALILGKPIYEQMLALVNDVLFSADCNYCVCHLVPRRSNRGHSPANRGAY